MIVVSDEGPLLIEIGEINYSLMVDYDLDRIKKGPATARNCGARRATGDIILFMGDDCIPDRNLFWRHLYAHYKNDQGERAVQGYTDWHPAIPPDVFMNFLNESGLQANWPALKNKDGSWKERCDGWFLTTNASIPKRLFDQIGGFNEAFPAAAWEDIELSFRLSKLGIPSFLEVDGINYHYHRHTLDSFARRNIVEGKSRLVICSLHPELSGSMLDPKGLRETSYTTFQEWMGYAKELHYARGSDIEGQQKTRWHEALRQASLEGIRQGIKERGGIWLAVPHVHTKEACRNVVAAAAATAKGDTIYALFEIETALRFHPDNWALFAARGEILVKQGSLDLAKESFLRALEIGPGEKWPVGALETINGR